MKLFKKAASKPLRDQPGFIIWVSEAVQRPSMNR